MRGAAATVLAALLSATACSTPPSTAAPSPTPNGAADTRPEARPGTPPAAVLIDDDGSGVHLRARPIDPATLADVPGYAPISFEHHYVAAVAPGGRTIAAILWPNANANSGAKVHIIDSASWTDRVLPVQIDSFTTAMHFDERGSAVYWAQPGSPSPAEPATALWRMDVDTASAREVARLPAGMSAREAIPFGDLAAVFAQPVGAVRIDGQPRDTPTLFVIDPFAEAIVRTIALPFRAGQYQDPKAVDPTEPWRTITPGLAWDVPRERVFIADAESDRIYRVDLRSGAVAGFDPQPRRSLIDLLWALVGGAKAEAKSLTASRQQATISPNGERLYVSGSRTEYLQTQDGHYQEQIVPLDLRVIDTRDMSEVVRHGASTGPLWVAPDGSSLLYGTGRYDPNATGYAFSEFKLHVADGSTGEDRATLDLSGDVWIASVDNVSRTAYVVSTSVVTNTLGRATLLAVDLQTGRTRVTRDMDRHYAEVLLVAPR